MHQNKIPRPAENRIIRIGDGAVFLIILQIRCVAPSMANTAIERKSGANPACKSVRPNSVDSAMLSAVARIIATTHGRTPDKKALTGAYFIRFFSADAIKRIIKNDGNTTPSVATNEPRIPPCVEPIKVAIFTARGPGVDSDTAIKFRNSFSVSQPLESTVSRTSETIPQPPPKDKAPIIKKFRKRRRYIMTFSHLLSGFFAERKQQARPRRRSGCKTQRKTKLL